MSFSIDEIKTVIVRNSIALLCKRGFLTGSQQRLAFQNIETIKQLFFTNTWQEMYLMLTLIQASQQVTWIDWLVVITCYAAKNRYVNEFISAEEFPDISIMTTGLNESDFLDNVVKHTKILEYILKTTSAMYSRHQIFCSLALASHIFHKFPQLANHSANIGHSQHYGTFQRVTFIRAEAFYVKFYSNRKEAEEKL